VSGVLFELVIAFTTVMLPHFPFRAIGVIHNAAIITMPPEQQMINRLSEDGNMLMAETTSKAVLQRQETARRSPLPRPALPS
jgi:hypothetical protein